MNGARTDEGQWVWQAKSARQTKHSLLNKHCRRTQPADSPPGTGLEETTACAERRVRRLCCLQLPCSAGCVCLQCLFCGLCFACLAIFACHAHCPHQHLAPVQFALPRSSFASLCFVHFISLRCPVHVHVRQDRCQGQQFASCKTVPLAAATRACSGGPCTGPFFLTYLFPCRVHDPDPWG